MQTLTLLISAVTLSLINQNVQAVRLRNKFCNVDIINSIEANGIAHSEPVKATKMMKEICPRLSHSCCDYSKLYDLAEHYKKGWEQIRNISNFYDKVNELVSDITPQSIEDGRKAYDRLQESGCMTYLTYHRLDNILSEINDKKADADKALSLLTAYIGKYYAGVGCSLCDPNNSASFFKVNSLGRTYMSFSFENYANIFLIMRYYTVLMDYLEATLPIAKLGLCVKNSAYKFTEAFDRTHDVQADLKFLDDCKNLNDFTIKEDENLECLKTVSSWGDLTTFSLFSDFKEDLPNLIEGLQRVKEGNNNEINFESFPEDIAFYPVKEDSALSKDNFSLMTGMNDPIVLHNSKFNTDIWENGKLPEYNAIEVHSDKGARDKDGKLILA